MLSKLYKICFDISVCYAFGAYLLKFFGGITIYGLGFLTLLITALVSLLLRQKRTLKICTAILIPAVSLLFYLPKVPELIVFLLIWAYYFYSSVMERFIIKRGEFLDKLKYISYFCLMLPFLMLVSLRNFSHAVQAASPYLIAAFVSAVFLLRYLRTEDQMEQMKRYRRQQFMEMLVFLGLCLLLTIARAPQNLVEGLKLLYLNLLIPVLSFLLSIVGMLIGGIIYLVAAVVSLFTNNKGMGEVKVNFGKTMRPSIVIPATGNSGAAWVIPLLYSIGAIIGLVVLFFFFRWLMGEKLKQRIPTGIQETREYLTDMNEKKEAFGKRRPKDSRAIVRYYYGKCLLWLQHRQVELRVQYTAEEIDYKYCNLPAKDIKVQRVASAQLKQIYWRARYGLAEQITKEDAEKAKNMYQEISKNKKR